MTALYYIFCKASDVGIAYGGFMLIAYLYVKILSIKNSERYTLADFNSEWFGDDDRIAKIFALIYIIAFISAVFSLILYSYVDERESLKWTAVKLLVISFSGLLSIIDYHAGASNK